MRPLFRILALSASLTFAQSTHARAEVAAAPAGDPIPVNVDNFIRAESDTYFKAIAVRDHGFGKFLHHREVADVKDQAVVRLNRDTLYSAAVFDLDAAPVTITLPDAGKRFMSMMVVDEDHYVHDVVYDAGSYTFTKNDIGTRYVLIGIRTLVDPSNPKDLEEVHTLQDALKISQASTGPI